jgi:hypothetical protein
MKRAIQTQKGMIIHKLLPLKKIKYKQMKILIFITFLVVSNNLFGQRVDFAVTGSWMKTISPSDISEAGNDYPSAFESNLNQTLLSIYPNNKNFPVYVYVTRSNDNWHDNLILKVKRNGNGTTTNTNISSGSLSYHLIPNAQPPSGRPTAVPSFFTCYEDFVNIPLQYEITGISVLLPVKSYSTTITYTVMY